MWIVDYLTGNGYCKTNGEARRLLRSGEIKFDGVTLNEESHIPEGHKDKLESPSPLGREYIEQRQTIQDKYNTDVKDGEKVWILAEYRVGWTPDTYEPVPILDVVGKTGNSYVGKHVFSPKEVIYKRDS